VLGRIEVQVLDRAGRWTTVGEVGETGPLALNVHLCPLPAMTGGPRTIRLRLAKGLWRLDFVALAVLGDPIEPIRLAPHEVRRGGACDEPARASLCDPERLLRTLPGDAYTLVYTLPDDGADYELFLDSQGYYLEWIRQEWLAEENQALAVMMLAEPALALHMLAPAFKAIEPEIESMFWESRYAHP
jgi:hypothetical protein